MTRILGLRWMEWRDVTVTADQTAGLPNAMGRPARAPMPNQQAYAA